MSSGQYRVLVLADNETAASDLAGAIERASGGSLAATPATDARPDAAVFDCLVCATAPETATEAIETLRAVHRDSPVVFYGPVEDATVDSLPADAFVQQNDEASTAVLADRIETLVEGQSAVRQQIAATIDDAEEAVFALDEEWRFTYLNGKAEQLLERPAAELVGESVWETFRAAVGSTFYDEYHTAVRTGEPTVFEEYYPPLDRHFEVAAYPSEDGLVVYFRDVTDTKRQEAALESVLETTRALMQARTREEVGELVASAAENTLEFDYIVVRVYDAERGVLEPVGWTNTVEADLDTPPTYALEEGPPGEVFASGEPQHFEDLSGEDYDVLRSAIHLPVGVHGTISIGATDPDAFGPVDRQVAEILATNAAVAFSRAKREQEAREARDRIETLLTRINGLVRDTLEVLVQASTREEIAAGVCESLTDADPYAFAWVGSADVTGETLTATEWAGDADFDIGDYERDLTAIDDGDPIAQALSTREQQVVSDLSTATDPWGERAAAAGLESLCAVPLTYKDTVYGVLTVYADRVDAFDDREQVVLRALGRAIADAINAVERGRILATNRVIEMELSSRDSDLLFSRLSAQADCRVESTGTLYQSDGRLQLYVTAETDDHEAVAAIAGDDDAVVDVTHIVTHDGVSLFELTVGESVVERLADYGAVTKRLVGEDGVTNVTVELPYESEARDIYDLLDEQYDHLDLVGYHEHDRPVQTRQEFRAALRERFTDRQETALRSAYLGGFFEWPREVDGDDLAGAMDITRPTYHQHLRTAERKVFEELFD